MSTETHQRRRNLKVDSEWLLEVARRLPNGHLEIEPFLTRNLRSGKRMSRIRVILMHNADAIALHGVGANLTEAMHELRLAVEMDVDRARRLEEGAAKS
jgi:hypothetical protein